MGRPGEGPVRRQLALADGKPVWKLEQVWPPDWKQRDNFRPMVWTGTDWNVKEGSFGGQPGASLNGRVLNFGTRAPHGTPPQRRVAGLTFVAPQAGTYRLSGTAECRIWDGTAKISVGGPWQNNEFQKIAGLIFITPQDGVYRIRATASSKPWTGGAKSFRLAVLKKDTQRAAEVQRFDLPRDGQSVKIDFQVELAAGHELVFLPLMPDWNNATTTTIEDLTIQAEK